LRLQVILFPWVMPNPGMSSNFHNYLQVRPV
jgi:hypothetical protein